AIISQNTPQIRIPLKGNTIHVPRFSLPPTGRRKNLHQRGDALPFGDTYFETNARIKAMTEEVIYYIKPQRTPRVIYAADIHQLTELTTGIIHQGIDHQA